MLGFSNIISKKTGVLILGLVLALIITILLTNFVFTPYSGSFTPLVQSYINKVLNKDNLKPKLINIGNEANAIKDGDQITIVDYNLDKSIIHEVEVNGKKIILIAPNDFSKNIDGNLLKNLIK
ncbi:MAG: hypothetical protein KatS3mg090_0613 [Patescibacteria group bacterium]|nr:MAG: hypothetical protein KatS3mg090_0613 [Patescibacteria group bacterium]